MKPEATSSLWERSFTFLRVIRTHICVRQVLSILVIYSAMCLFNLHWLSANLMPGTVDSMLTRTSVYRIS